MIIQIFKLAKGLKLNYPDLITRPVGRIMYKKMKEMLQHASRNEVILLDFENIKVIDSSFIDELIVKLILESRDKSNLFFVKIKNISEIAEINIDSVFKSYSLYNQEKICVITTDICQNNSFFIGPLSVDEKEIIEFLRVNESASFNDIHKFSDLANDELLKLLESLFLLRLIRKNNDNIFLAV